MLNWEQVSEARKNRHAALHGCWHIQDSDCRAFIWRTKKISQHFGVFLITRITIFIVNYYPICSNVLCIKYLNLKSSKNIRIEVTKQFRNLNLTHYFTQDGHPWCCILVFAVQMSFFFSCSLASLRIRGHKTTLSKQFCF